MRHSFENPPPLPEKKPSTQPSEKEDLELSYDAHLISPVCDIFANHNLPINETIQDMFAETPENRFNPKTKANNRKGSGFLQIGRVINETISKSKPYSAHRFGLLLDYPDLTVFLPNLITYLNQTHRQNKSLITILKQIPSLLKEREQLQREERALQEKKEAQPPNTSPKTEIQKQHNTLKEALAENDHRLSQMIFATKDAWEEVPEDERKNLSFWRLSPEQKNNLTQHIEKLPYDDRMEARLLLDLLDPTNPKTEPNFPKWTSEKYIGTCTTAEAYFTDFVTKKNTYDTPTIIVDINNQPIMLYKNAGEKSALLLKEITVDGVRYPPGALLGLKTETTNPEQKILHERDVKGVQFLRLTTFATEQTKNPEHRKATIGHTALFQEENGFGNTIRYSIHHFEQIATDNIKYETIKQQLQNNSSEL